jgi:predicted branched-subunit amino acid permease
MVNSKYFLLGLKSLAGGRSPAVALATSFIALGAIFKHSGFNLEQSVASSLFTYALPGQLVMTESYLIGASLINIFISVWLVNFRFYPMTVALMPALQHKNQPRFKYYISCHFLAVSSWLIMKEGYKKIDKRFRLDYWIGIGSGTLTSAVFSTTFGYLISDYLSNDLMIALGIVNPVYFLCMMVGAMTNIKTTVAIVVGGILGPVFYLFTPEWSILISGFIGGSLAFLIKEKK